MLNEVKCYLKQICDVQQYDKVNFIFKGFWVASFGNSFPPSNYELRSGLLPLLLGM